MVRNSKLVYTGRCNMAAPQIATVQNEHLDPRIQDAVDGMCRNYRRQFRIGEFARGVGMSISSFAHLFRQEMGVSPARFLREVKFRKAEELIRTTSLPLREVLDLAGITERSHFIRMFKRRYGLSPSIYRAQVLPTLPCQGTLHIERGIVKGVPTNEFAD